MRETYWFNCLVTNDFTQALLYKLVDLSELVDMSIASDLWAAHVHVYHLYIAGNNKVRGLCRWICKADS